MMEQQIRIPELQTFFDEFICPITRLIISDPVLGHKGTSFERSAIQQWIDRHGVDPITLQPLQRKDLKPNRQVRESIYKFVQALTNKQKKRLQYLNVYQVARLREKQLDGMAQRSSSIQKEVQKLLRQLKLIKNQLSLQRQQKEFAIRQCQLQKNKVEFDRKKLNSYENQMVQIKARNLILQQLIKNKENQIEAFKNQNIVLRNQKETAKIQSQIIFQQIQTYQKENLALKEQNLQLRQLQKGQCLEIEELKQRLNNCRCKKQEHEKLVPRSRNVKIIPDKQARGLKEGNWVIDNTNSNICILNTDGYSNWLCSSSLPFDGEFVFTIKFIKLNEEIYIGVMETGKKEDQWEDTWNYSVYLDTFSQNRV